MSYTRKNSTVWSYFQYNYIIDKVKMNTYHFAEQTYIIYTEYMYNSTAKAASNA